MENRRRRTKEDEGGEGNAHDTFSLLPGSLAFYFIGPWHPRVG